MRIYVFVEHYPNTYKPYYDAQLAQFLQDGHQVRVFAFGKFDRHRNGKVVEYGLDRRTTYCPSTLRTLAPFALALPLGFLRRPRAAASAAAAGATGDQSLKLRFLDAARALRLPPEPPDLCLIQSLVTAQYYGFLGRLYPTARLALYFHGGEVPDGGGVCEDASSLFAGVHRVFTNTSFSRAQVITRGCPPEKVVICPVGFRVEDYRPPKHKRYRRGGLLRVVAVGRVSVEKGLAYALDALHRLQERDRARVQLRIVGAGLSLSHLEARIRSEGLSEQVRLCGELAHHALAAEYAEADALVLPSVPTPRWAETQACVVQEAMLMKLAVIASRTGGVPESLAPALHRFSVEPRDAAGIARRLEQLLELPEEELQALGEEGRAFASAHYDVRELNRRLLAQAMELAPISAAPSLGAAGRPAAREAQGP